MPKTDSMAETQTSNEVHLSTENKIYGSLDRLRETVDSLKMEGKTIGYVTGTFDVTHLGQAAILDFAKQNCDILIVSVASDGYAKTNKKQVFFDQHDRCLMLSSSAFVDLIFKFAGPSTPTDSLEWKAYLDSVEAAINPDVIIASSKTDANFETKKRDAEATGKKFVEFSDPPYSSSTKIKSWLEENY